MTGLRSAEGVSRSLGGSDVVQLPVKYLRLSESNVRFEYGFNPEVEDHILSVIRSKYIALLNGDDTFAAEEKNLILENLADPAIANDPTVDQRKTIGWLVNSISSDGVQETLRGFWNSDTDEFTTTDGNRRLVAIAIARLQGTVIERVYVRTEEINPKSANAESQYLKRQLTANSGREYNPIEKAEVLSRLKKLGSTDEELAVLAGNMATVRYLLKLLDTSPEVQRLVAMGEVKPTVAVSVVESAIAAGNTHEEISQAMTEAVQEAREDRKARKSEAKKTSKGKIEAKLTKHGKATKIAPVDDGDKESLIDELKEVVLLDEVKNLSSKQLSRVLNLLKGYVTEVMEK